MGVYGIARDLAAAGLGSLKPLISSPAGEGLGWVHSGHIAGHEESNPTLAARSAPIPTSPLPGEEFSSCPISITIADSDGCTAFSGRVIRGVTNGASPEWLQRTLTAAGMRPISALVDITNYFTLAFGRPLHVYDLTKLKGNITVRTATDDEQLLALNDKTYRLAPRDCVIADDSGAIGIGGIMGYASFGFLADWLGRRPTIVLYNLGAIAAGLYLYLGLDSYAGYPVMLVVFGYFVFGVFSGHAVYLPELFPTHARATAIAFCNGSGRVITSFGPLVAGLLVVPFGSFNNAAAAMTCFAVLSIIAMALGRETRDDELPR
jgi:hypothetical protein